MKTQQIQFESASLQLPGRHAFVINGVLPLKPGSANILTGRNGAGKTLTLSAVAAAAGFPALGLARSISGANYSCADLHHIALVRQEPLENFFSRIAADEISLPLLRPGLERSILRSRIDTAISRLAEPDRLLTQRLPRLNAGALQELALAISTVAGSRLILLDEPFSRLDERGKHRAARSLGRSLKEHGTTAVITTHEPTSIRATLSEEIDVSCFLVSREGSHIRINAVGRGDAERASSAATPTDLGIVPLKSTASRALGSGSVKIAPGRGGEAIASFHNLEVAHGINFLVGPNASGKTTLGRFLAGLIPLQPMISFLHPLVAQGSFLWEGGQPPAHVAKAGRSVFLSAEPEHWLAHETVRGELDALWAGSEVPEVMAILDALDVGPNDSLDNLSYGQKKCISLLSLPPGLTVVILDEPFVDLSPEISRLLADWVRQRVDRREWESALIATNRHARDRKLFDV